MAFSLAGISKGRIGVKLLGSLRSKYNRKLLLIRINWHSESPLVGSACHTNVLFLSTLVSNTIDSVLSSPQGAVFPKVPNSTLEDFSTFEGSSSYTII